MLKSTFSGLQRCRGQCGSIFIRLAVVASQIHEIPRNSAKSLGNKYLVDQVYNVFVILVCLTFFLLHTDFLLWYPYHYRLAGWLLLVIHCMVVIKPQSRVKRRQLDILQCGIRRAG